MNEPGSHPSSVNHALHSYVSDLALRVMIAAPESGFSQVDGSLAFFDVSGFTKLSERLARLGRSGAEAINDVLNIVFKGLIAEVFRNGGDVLEFGGDAMVVLYTGPDHERRAAVAAADMYRFMARDGRIETPLGAVRLRMSCGIATGEQAYYLAGLTRRALIVAGPASTEMAQLEASANAGEVLINERLAAALPRSWVGHRRTDGALQLRLSQVTAHVGSEPIRVTQPANEAELAALLPTQFRSLFDGLHRDGELKQVAMAFIRLGGTDDLLGAEGTDSVHRRLNELSEIVDSAAAEFDVCWLETQAEANSVRWTLIAGAPTATERDGERLLRVLCRIADQTPVPLRIGANLGVVFVGDMGHPQRCTYIVMGDATNLAARLMTKAAPGQVIASEQLINSCAGRFDWTPLEPFPVKGKRALIRAGVVEGLAEGDQFGAALSADGGEVPEPPMLGREAELAQLLGVIRRGGVAAVVGEAGVGKTRIWHEARRIEVSRQWLVMGAEPHEVAAPYAPFRRLIRAAANIGVAADERTAGTLIEDFVARSASNLLPWLPLIADVIGADVPSTDEVAALAPAFRTDRLRAAVADLILAFAGPDAVIVFEDAHWVDDSSRALVEVLSNLLGARHALVLTSRPHSWSPSSATTIEMGSIGNEIADQLLVRELPANAASDATLSRLRSSANGNPLFLIELARSVATSAGQTDTAFPQNVERLLAARIDQLPVAARELIRDASVLGSTMSRELAARVLDRSDLADSATWERELGDLMVLDEHTVRFRHDLVRVAAYEGLSVRRRRAVHQRAGDVIEAWGNTAPIADIVAAMAFHATGSGIPQRIMKWNQQAAEGAIEKGAMEIAEGLLRDVASAQRQVGVTVDARCATQRRLAFAAERSGHPESALLALGQASHLAEVNERALIAVDQARLLEKLGRYRSALATTARALALDPDESSSGHLRLARATIRNFQGRWNDCLGLVEGVLRDFETSDDQALLAQAHLLAEWSCMRLGRPDRADHERAALSLLTDLDDSIGLANLYLNRGFSAWAECRATDAVTDFRTSSEFYERAGDVVGAALSDNNLAEVLTLQSHLEAAEDLLVRARRVLEAANYPLGTLLTISGLSRIAAWRGNVTDALRQQSLALNGFQELRADEYIVDSLVRLVEIHVFAGDALSALTAADEAARALETLGAVPVLPATLKRLKARALLLAGRPAEARVEFETALTLATGDGFIYERALASLGIARMDDDEQRAAGALAELRKLGVLAPPPGS